MAVVVAADVAVVPDVGAGASIVFVPVVVVSAVAAVVVIFVIAVIVVAVVLGDWKED